MTNGRCEFADCPEPATERVAGFGEYCEPHAVLAQRSANRMPSAAPAIPDKTPEPTVPERQIDPEPDQLRII